ncbi:hypothetical protein [Methylobacterium fujisawaense]
MKKVRFPGWLERRPYSAHTKLRIASGRPATKVPEAEPAQPTTHGASGNVIRFALRARSLPAEGTAVPPPSSPMVVGFPS